MSKARLQAFIEAPVPVVWELVADVDRHQEWWPRVVEVHCEGLEEGCTYREVVKPPFGRQETMEMRIERLDHNNEELRIRCINTGTYFKLALTEAQNGTFVDGEAGMEPATLQNRVFDAVAGKRYFRTWMRQTLDALNQVAQERGQTRQAAKAESGQDATPQAAKTEQGEDATPQAAKTESGQNAGSLPKRA